MQSSLITSNKHKLFDALLKQKGINVRQTETIPRCEKADAYPLSFAQQRLWFLDQLEPGKALYNLPAAVRLRGQLDISALSRSFDEVVRRHESLRTTFKSVAGQPRQVIAEPGALPLPLLDLTGLGVSERQAEVACFGSGGAQMFIALGTPNCMRSGGARCVCPRKRLHLAPTKRQISYGSWL